MWGVREGSNSVVWVDVHCHSSMYAFVGGREKDTHQISLFPLCCELSNTMGDYDTVILDIEGTITPITFVKNTLVR